LPSTSPNLAFFIHSISQGLFVWGFVGWFVNYSATEEVPKFPVSAEPVTVFPSKINIPGPAADETFINGVLTASWAVDTITMGIATAIEAEKCMVETNNCTLDEIHYVAYGTSDLKWEVQEGEFFFVADGYSTTGEVKVNYGIEIDFSWPGMLLLGAGAFTITVFVMWSLRLCRC